MALTIPQRFRPTFAMFTNLHADAMIALVEAVRVAIPASSIRAYATGIENAGKVALSEDDLYNILVMLGNLYHVRTSGDWPSLDDFIRDLIDAAKREDPKIPPEKSTSLAGNLRYLLDPNGSLAISAKASELRSEHQRVLCTGNCRVLTDLRPVFLEDVKQGPKAVFIQHILKLDYHDDSGRDAKEFFVALDEGDLRRLKSLIDRAIAKGNSLRGAAQIDGAVILGEGEVVDEEK